jgi:AcrR family transcriptional regulator
MAKTKKAVRKSVEPRPNALAALLEGAIEIIQEHGVEGLTYERLSERTGISKGGILYHFPNRQEMNRAIRKFVREQYINARNERVASLPAGVGRELKGWALASLSNRSNLDAISAKIMTSGMWDHDEGSAHHSERFKTISADVGFDRAALVYLATEGLWFLELVRFSPFERKERARVVDLLISLADSGEFQAD